MPGYQEAMSILHPSRDEAGRNFNQDQAFRDARDHISTLTDEDLASTARWAGTVIQKGLIDTSNTWFVYSTSLAEQYSRQNRSNGNGDQVA